MNKTCARCEKTVYPTEELKCLDKVWHKGCFKCQECGMTLNMKTYKGYGKLPYCESHVPKAKHTTMAETPELKRIAENTKIQSNVKYHADFEKSKGKFTQVADDPETLRIKANTKIISNVAYHGDLEKKAQMEKQRQINENGELVDLPTDYHQQIDNYATEMLPPPNLPPKSHYQTPVNYNNAYQMQNVIPPPQNYMNQHEYKNTSQNVPMQHQNTSHQSNSSHQGHVSSHQGHVSSHQGHVSSHHSNSSHQTNVASHQTNVSSHQSNMPAHQGNVSSLHSNVTSHQANVPSHQANVPSHQGNVSSHQSNSSLQSNSSQPNQQRYQDPYYNQKRDDFYQYQDYNYGNQAKIGRIQDYDPVSDGPRAPPNTQRASATLIYNSTSDKRGANQPSQSNQPRSIGRVTELDPLANELTQHRHNANANQSTTQINQKVFIAMYDYEANDSDEVSFREGDLISNVSHIDEGWMTGQVLRTGHAGMLPANYVAEYQNPQY